MREDILAQKEQILKWVEEKLTKTEICHRLQCKISTLNSYLDKMGIEYEGQMGFKSISKYIEASEYLNDNKYIGSWKLKNKLLKEHIKEAKCELCGLTKWLDKDIPLELHHIDGNRYNNQLDNLQLLCPNCHSMQENNCGKNLGKYSSKYHRVYHNCKMCGKPISRSSKNELCIQCSNGLKRKVERPDREQLKQEIRTSTFTNLSKKYGVSDKAIVKWCISYNLPSKTSIIKSIKDDEWNNI